MTILRIDHRTTHAYRQLIRLGPHRLMLRPRESRGVRLVSTELTITPQPSLTWANDVFGNTVATATFVDLASLTIESNVTLDHSREARPIFDIAASAIAYPFIYAEDERPDLGAILTPQYHDPDRRLASWAEGLVRSDVTDTLSMLKD
jgi:hypothetical protein